ncbi:MAG: insulinase family protein, partial [Lachnospiraceae bacterium]|nr:insulinase family protein [Lachnospiraceae bacterium]
NCYGFDSGGDPVFITDLTYEKYLENHARYYHPSNARIFLDGNIDTDAVLGRIDEYLSDFDQIEVNADIPYQQPVTPPEAVVPYEIGEEDEEENKVLLAEGYVYGKYTDTLKSLGFSVISSVLAGSNEAPLKKAILDEGLAEDISVTAYNESMQQPFLMITVDNTSLANKDRVFETIRRVFKEQAEQGLDRTRVNAVLNNIEFTAREKDFGGIPKGLVYAMSTLDSWLYGGDPMQNLLTDKLFKEIREKIEEGFLEDLIRTEILESAHHARLVMTPSKTLGKEKQEAEEKRLLEKTKDWDEAKKLEVIAQFKKLRERQNMPDLPEALASLPMLSLSDIPDTVPALAQEVTEENGVTVLLQPNDTDGITYLDLFFSLADIPEAELSNVAFYASLLTQLPTENFDILGIRSEIEANLGVFAAAPTVFSKKTSAKDESDWMAVRLSFLKDKAADALRIIREVLLTSRADDAKTVSNILKQTRFGMEQSVIGAGNRFGYRHAIASFQTAAAVQERFSGLLYLRCIQELDRRFEADSETVLQTLNSLGARLFTKNRLTISVTGDYADGLVEKLTEIFPEGEAFTAAARNPLPKESLAIVIPAEVGFATKGVNTEAVGLPVNGTAEVAAQFLTFNYLWNTIRVKGGAYGTGLAADDSGNTGIYSYRDPNPKGSLEAYAACGEELRAFAASDEPIDKYIISTLSNTDPLLTPKSAGKLAASLYFRGVTQEDRQRERSEILHTDKETLADYSRTLDKALSEAAVCVIAGKATIDAMEGVFDRVENLQ